MNQERISLKPSPLISTLSYLYTKFPTIQTSKIDSCLIQHKFDYDSVEQYLDQTVLQDLQNVTGAQASDDWFGSVDPHIGLSNPRREIKVYRFEPDDWNDA
jgi:hypothetical protein